MDNEICILGAGGHAKVVIEIAELSGVKISGVYDHNHNVMQILQYPVFHNLSQLANAENVFVALGGNESRKKNAEALPKHGIKALDLEPKHQILVIPSHALQRAGGRRG